MSQGPPNESLGTDPLPTSHPLAQTPACSRILRSLWGVLISHRLCVACLFGLFLVTWFGTLYQVDHGLYMAQRDYFESWFIAQRLGDLFVGPDMPAWLDESGLTLPLPGGMLLMSLLALNLVCGGGVRIVRSLRGGAQWIPRLGVLTVHLGIAILLLAGFVRFHHALEGSATLLEGRATRTFHSFHEWEIAVMRQVSDGEVEEHLIPGEHFLDLVPGKQARFVAPGLPFTIVITQATRNGEPRPKPGGIFEIKSRPLQKEHERNIAACAVEVIPHHGPTERAILWGHDVAPWTVAAKDGVFGLQLRKKTWLLPFGMRLDKFTAEMHPGTRKPKAFVSDVTVRFPDGDERKARIAMNEPFRHGNLVVYQSTYGPEGGRPGGNLFSGFQIVENVSDQWPLYGCLVISFGMLLVFGFRLLRHLRRSAVSASALLAMCLLATESSAQEQQRQPWNEEIIAITERLPVMEDGRVKPLLTHVSYLLLRVNGQRTLALPKEPQFGTFAGRTLSPVEWALDLWLFPEQADRYPAFLLQNSEVADAMGLEHTGKRRRDRWSYAELRPGLTKLFTLAQRHGAVKESERSGLEQQLVLLAQNVSDYQRLSDTFAPARQGIADWIQARWNGRADPDPARTAMLSAVVGDAGYLRLFPPPDPAQLAWLAPGEQPGLVTGRREALQLLRHHEQMVVHRLDQRALLAELTALERALKGQMRSRGEGDRLAMEVSYLQADWVWRSLYGFGMAFVLACLAALLPRRRWPITATWLVTVLAISLLVTGIVMRCVLRQRPPITGLYETILFVTATGTLTALVIEWLQRRRVALTLAAALGFFGTFVAAKFEVIDGRDTMPTLLAVLDTNFWLATHVTIINLGYAGALLAGFLAHVSLLAPAVARFRASSGSAGIARRSELGPAIYGTLCFATLFTTVGTILGGIWANDSWGRFWGFDPKENGALMIVLWNLMILHGRMGGFLKDHGIAMCAVAGNIVVVFSWFHTNLLGVGLHSYGFASGLSSAVWTFYGVELMVLLAGWYLRPGGPMGGRGGVHGPSGGAQQPVATEGAVHHR